MHCKNQNVAHSNNCSSIHKMVCTSPFQKLLIVMIIHWQACICFISRILFFLYRDYIRQFKWTSSPFTKYSLKLWGSYRRIKVPSFMRLSGMSPPAASFQERPLTMFLKNSSVNDLNANFLLMEDFCFNLIILGRDNVNNYVNIIQKC